MDEKPDVNEDVAENPDDSGTLRYNRIIETPVDELFDLLGEMDARKMLRLISKYCLAKSLTEKSIVPENTRMELLKEAGRDTRALIKDFSGDGDDDDRGPFSG